MTILQTMYDMLRFSPADLSFLFILLPGALALYYLAPVKLRPAVLLILSLWFCFLTEPGALLLMAASVTLDYCAMRLMAAFDGNQRIRGICGLFSIVKNLGIIVWFGVQAQLNSTPLILGLQIYTLSAMGAVMAAYKREIPYERSIVRFGLYCCFFPKLYAGPLALYGEFTAQLEGVRLQIRPVLLGLGQFIGGAFKTAVLGRGLYELYKTIGKLDPAEVTALSSWCRVFTVAFALYFLLSGFSDMAKGIGAMFGIILPNNFYYPYQSRCMEDFFDRFNITVSRFIRKTINIGAAPANQRLTGILNILLMGMLMGLWFGLRLNYLAWGLFLAVFVVLERYAYPKLLARIPTLFCRTTTLCVVLASFTIFAGESLAESAALIRSMFDFGNFVNDTILYLLLSNWLLILAGCFLATNAVNLTFTKFRRAAPRVAGIVLGAVDAAILVLLVALTI